MVGIATCLAAQTAKGLYVIAIQENALLGAKKGGEEKKCNRSKFTYMYFHLFKDILL